MKLRLARWLRTTADRLDYDGAPKAIGWFFTYERGHGIRFRDDGRGCRLWYLGGEAMHERAHTEADSAQGAADGQRTSHGAGATPHLEFAGEGPVFTRGHLASRSSRIPIALPPDDWAALSDALDLARHADMWRRSYDAARADRDAARDLLAGRTSLTGYADRLIANERARAAAAGIHTTATESHGA